MLLPATRCDDEEWLDNTLLLYSSTARLQPHRRAVGRCHERLELLKVTQRDEEAGRTRVDETEQLALNGVKV